MGFLGEDIEACMGGSALSCAAIIPWSKFLKGLKVAKGVRKTGARACSFTGSTLVLMADGSKKPIEDVQVGDKVIATDPETGERVARRVTKVWVHGDQVIDLAVDDEVFSTTEDHQFWSVTDQRFERADQLAEGEQVLGAGGEIVTVTGLRFGTSRHTLAYNLAVAGIHTYHVGQSEILVHNECGLNSASRPGKIASYLGYSVREIKDAIHAVKRHGLPKSGPRANPDVVVDLDTGDVYVKMPNGKPSSDSIGNIFEHLRDR